jgi:hypothetical protein
MISAVLRKIFRSLLFLSYFQKYSALSFSGLFISCSFIILYFNSFALAQNNPCDTPPCTIAGNAEYKKNWHFYWLPSNPQTIGRNSEVAVGVFGGYPPFTWTVSGNGFSLANDETNERTNVLISGSAACGAASITVTDTNGYTTTGSLRCSSGRWSSEKPGCVFGGVDEYVYEGGATYHPSNWPLWTYTVGKYQQSQGVGRTWAGDCGQTCTNCPNHCAQKAAESPQYQCSPCLNNTSIVPCRWIQNQGQCCTIFAVNYKEWVCE